MSDIVVPDYKREGELRARIARLESALKTAREALTAAVCPLEALGIVYADQLGPGMKDEIVKARSLAIPVLSAIAAALEVDGG